MRYLSIEIVDYAIEAFFNISSFKILFDIFIKLFLQFTNRIYLFFLLALFTLLLIIFTILKL